MHKPQQGVPLKVSPLLVRNAYNEDPIYWENAFKRNYLRYGSRNEDCTQVKDNVLFISRINGHEFYDANVYTCPLELTEKLQEILIDKTLDYLINIPGANFCKITKIVGKLVYFEHVESNYDADNLPIRTKKNALAVARLGLIESYTERTYNKISQNLINRSIGVNGVGKTIDHLVKSKAFNSKQLRDELVVKANVQQSGSSNGYQNMLAFTNGIDLKDNKINIPNKLPDVIVTALPGQPATVLIDHWVFEGCIIKSVRQFKTKSVVTLESKDKVTLRDLVGDSINKVILSAKRTVEKTTPEAYKDYAEQVEKGLK